MRPRLRPSRAPHGAEADPPPCPPSSPAVAIAVAAAAVAGANRRRRSRQTTDEVPSRARPRVAAVSEGPSPRVVSAELEERGAPVYG